MACRYCQNGWFSIEPCPCSTALFSDRIPSNRWPNYNWKPLVDSLSKFPPDFMNERNQPNDCNKIEKYYKGFNMNEKETIKELEKKIIRAICKCEMYRDAYEDMGSIFEEIIKELS